jgi:hypothetical protein
VPSSVFARKHNRRSFRPALLIPALLASAWLGALGGCSSLSAPPRQAWDIPQGEPFKPGNFTDAGPLPASIRRVAVLPLHTDEWRPADIAAIEASFLAELGKTARFESTAVTRREVRVRFGHESFLSSAALPPELPGRLRADFAADAVLFVDLTHFAPYQPLALGVRAKLVAADDSRVLWSFDAVFDAAQPAVAVAARKYQMENDRAAPPLDGSAGILQSPARFARYVAHDVFATLPGRATQNK